MGTLKCHISETFSHGDKFNGISMFETEFSYVGIIKDKSALLTIAVTTGIITKVSASSVHWGRCEGSTTDLG